MSSALKWMLSGFLFLSISCTEDADNDKGKSKKTSYQNLQINNYLQTINEEAQAWHFAVIDENNQLLVDTQFKINQKIVSTDTQGVLKFSKVLPKNILISSPGFVTTQFLNITPKNLVFKIKKQRIYSKQIQIQGNTSGFGKLTRDKKFDFSLVLPSFRRSNLVLFDASNILSPEVDTIKVPTQTVNVASNLTLPKQSEKYLFFTIKFDKPQYRLYVPEPGNYSLFATHGQFPMKKIMKGFRNGNSMIGMLNYFDFKQGGFNQVTAPGDVSGQDMIVNQVQYDDSINVKSGSFNASQVMISAVFMNRSQELYPSDIKLLKANSSMDLKVAKNFKSNGYLLSILKEDDLEKTNPKFKQLSMTIQGVADAANAPQFLEHIPSPQLANSKLNISLPTLPKSLVEYSTVTFLSEIEKINRDGVETEKRTVMYEVVQPGWSQQIDISQFKVVKKPGLFYRWEIVLMAAPVSVSNTAPVFSQNYEQVTHATLNSIEL